MDSLLSGRPFVYGLVKLCFVGVCLCSSRMIVTVMWLPQRSFKGCCSSLRQVSHQHVLPAERHTSTSTFTTHCVSGLQTEVSTPAARTTPHDAKNCSQQPHKKAKNWVELCHDNKLLALEVSCSLRTSHEPKTTLQARVHASEQAAFFGRGECAAVVSAAAMATPRAHPSKLPTQDTAATTQNRIRCPALPTFHLSCLASTAWLVGWLVG